MLLILKASHEAFLMHLCRMKFITLALAGLYFIVLLTSCGEGKKTKAKIFERKHLPENKLQIKYQYMSGGIAYADSMIIENKVLMNDSVTISIDPKDPSKSVVEAVK